MKHLERGKSNLVFSVILLAAIIFLADLSTNKISNASQDAEKYCPFEIGLIALFL